MNKIILLVCVLFYISINSQNKKRVSVKVGTEYRITPIYKISDNVNPYINQRALFNLDKQLSGTSINYDISYEIFKNFEIGFSQSFRYDHLYYERNNNLLEPNNVNFLTVDDSKSKWITDYHFYVKKNFTLNENSKLFVKLGLSLMNRGTEYSASEVILTNTDGTIGAIDHSEYDFTFFAINTSIGYSSKKFDIAIGSYFVSGSSANLIDERSIIIPYFKLSYQLF